jgi:asparagine synthase (glutamine-hydrolysing)
MQARASRPVRTFTIGFGEDSHNEAEHARAVSRHLGTEHTELYVESASALAVAPLLPTLYDEPFADPSQIPTYLVAQLARQHVTVGLSGDGGDELFGGYHRYFWVQNIWRKLGWMPTSVRAALAGVLSTVPVHSWDGLFSLFDRVLPARLRYSDPGEKLHKLADLLASRSAEDVYWGMVEHWRGHSPVIGMERVQLAKPTWIELPDLMHRMMYMDSISYLPDDILTKVDRAAMGVSLETRVPFLDHRVFEFAWRLPASMKARNGQGKWVLRQLLYRHVPQVLVERPKMGFGIPINDWLRGPLRDWAADLLAPAKITGGGYLATAAIQSKWDEHQAGRRDWSSALWDALMFQAWYAHHLNGKK